MNKHIEELVELSLTDKKIDSYQPQIDMANKKIAKAQKKLTDAQDGMDELSALIEENEQKVASYEEQLKILNDQLAGNVKKSKDISTEKEMKALAVEEDIAKEKMTFANEEIERLQVVNGKKTEEIEEIKESVESLTKDLATATKEAETEIAAIENSKASLFAQREATIREIDQKVLAFYEKIRIWAGNSAVVPVKKQACYGCFMKLNDKAYADIIRGEEIITCPHCGRILYIERETAEA